MRILNNNPGLSLRTLAAQMESEPATVTRMIRRMEAHGLIRREKDQTDSRILHFYLTRQGEKKRLETVAVHTEMAHRLFRGFTENERTYLEEVFSRMTDNIRSEGK